MKIDNNKIRLRFAPSPTGFLHIGSLRTVLFDYLAARSLKGKLILRIEDTDQKRQVDGAVEGLINILDWVGIKFDEGPHVGGEFGPYVQSQRLDIYDKYSEQLLRNGSAYRCFCTPERLQMMREEQQAQKLPPRYDRACREIDEETIKQNLEDKKKYVIRQKMPMVGNIDVFDELRGTISFNARELEDHVLIKSDGVPTYHFAVVIDDHLMEITHVIRGEEWIPSFPKNFLLYKEFGWTPPKFIHMALTLNKGGGKLSKRQGDVAVEDYREKGYLAEAILNFCALLGWHPKDEQELMDIDELINKFDYKDMGTSPAVFDLEKLDYLNGYYIRHKTIDELADLCVPYLKIYAKENEELSQNICNAINEHISRKSAYLKNVIVLEKERMKKLSEVGVLTEFFFKDSLNYPWEMLVWKQMSDIDVKVNLQTIVELLEKIPDENWTKASLEDAIMSFITAKNAMVGEYLWPMRVSLTGRKGSPGPFEVAETLGKSNTLTRIIKAIELLSNI
jgi:glutamyl-tRNA synthetase